MLPSNHQLAQRLFLQADKASRHGSKPKAITNIRLGIFRKLWLPNAHRKQYPGTLKPMQKAVCQIVPADRPQKIQAYCAIARTSEKAYETIAAQIRDYKSSNKTPFNAKQENRAQAGKLQTTSTTTLPIQQSRKATKPLNNYPLTQVKQLTKHYGANPRKLTYYNRFTPLRVPAQDRPASPR